jgi:hypothetical protein
MLLSIDKPKLSLSSLWLIIPKLAIAKLKVRNIADVVGSNKNHFATGSAAKR